MNQILLENQIYYLADTIVIQYPDEFKESKKRPRQMITYKQIPEDSYQYMSFVKGEWKHSTAQNPKAKVLVKKEWLESFLSETKSDVKKEEDKVIERIVQEAPPILDLSDDEMFKNEKGQTLTIEVRGERHEDKCFFRVKDVSILLNSPNLIDHVTQSGSAYELGTDYVYFYCPLNYGAVKNKEQMYFTFNGICRCFYVSRGSFAQHFRKWATRVLFTAQMGTPTQRRHIASELLGVSSDVICQYTKTNVRGTPLVYMTSLGSLPSDLLTQIKNHDKNPDDYILIKFGGHGFNKETLTGFEGRIKGHKQEFKEFKDMIRYLHLVFIDPMYVSQVEKEMKHFFQPYLVTYKSHKEVCAIPKSELDNIRTFFRLLSYQYSGNTVDIQRTFDQFKATKEMEMNQLRHEMDKAILENQMYQKLLQEKERIESLQQQLIHALQHK